MKTLYESLSSSLIDDSKYNILVIVKPGFFDNIQYIIDQYIEKGWVLDRMRTKQLLLSEAKQLYSPHKGKEFYKDLCKYMSCGSSTALLFTKDVPFSDKMFEETNSIKDKIRKEIGKDEMKNAIHSSDSLERLPIERGIYF